MSDRCEKSAACAIERDGRVTPLSDLRHESPRRFPEPPKVAVVVGTFAAVPYVHLHLEARRRFYPEVPLLVHDDASPKAAALAALCRDYGADFERNTPRLPPCKGDLCAFAGGLAWARENGAGLLVKMSRRFVPLGRWVDGLVALAVESDYATCNAWTTSYDFGFRTECLALAVAEWNGAMGEIIEAIRAPGSPFVEGFMHDLARRAASRNTPAAQDYDRRVGARPTERNGYAVWSFLGTDRCAPSAEYLWHDWACPRDYATLAERWGLAWREGDFADPNMGCGAQPK